MIIDTANIFLNDDALPSYSARLGSGSRIEERNGKLFWILGESKDIEEKRSILLATLDLACYTKLRTVLPIFQFVTSKIHGCVSENVDFKNICFDEIIILVSGKTRSGKKKVTCKRAGYELEFVAIPSSEIEVVDDLPNIDKKLCVESTHFMVSKELVNIFGNLNGPEIIDVLLKDIDLKSNFDIYFLSTSSIGEELYIAGFQDLTETNKSKIQMFGYSPNANIKVLLVGQGLNQRVSAYLTYN